MSFADEIILDKLAWAGIASPDRGSMVADEFDLRKYYSRYKLTDLGAKLLDVVEKEMFKEIPAVSVSKVDDFESTAKSDHLTD